MKHLKDVILKDQYQELREKKKKKLIQQINLKI